MAQNEWSYIVNRAGQAAQGMPAVRGGKMEEICAEVFMGEIRAYIAARLGDYEKYTPPPALGMDWMGGAMVDVWDDINDPPCSVECGEYKELSSGEIRRLCQYHVEWREDRHNESWRHVAPAIECECCNADTDRRIAEYEAERAYYAAQDKGTWKDATVPF